MKKDEILKSKDGKCPYCGSANVKYTGVNESDIGASSTPEYPEPLNKRWQCNNCKEVFFYHGE